MININNITNPGIEPVDGDWIEIHHDNGAVERKVFYVPLAKPAITLNESKALKIAAIRAHFEALVAGVKADAAPYEVATWETQRQEYMAWMSNNTTPIPYVAGLAAARGLTIPDLMAKIGVKVAGFATIQGTQHALEKQVEAATTIAEVEAIAW